MIRLILFTLVAWVVFSCHSQIEHHTQSLAEDPVPGANQIDTYLSMLKGKRIGLCVNHTSLIANSHLVDTLQSLDIDVVKVFTPEHGFRGQADAGEKVADESIDELQIFSLYGKNKKPTADQMKGIDLMIFDMQDVGTRFFTYISTMHYLMEACAENDVPLLILDRPNPNDYIDGPTLDSAFKSFVGMHPIPAVHGLTVGELAQMINGENWLGSSSCDLKVVAAKNWSHGAPYLLPVKPSPNLPNQQAINWYPTLCFFEGSYFTVGRGTAFPFQVVGAEDFPDTTFSFTPISRPGAKYPKFRDTKCYGLDLRKVKPQKAIDLRLIKDIYARSDTSRFFTSYFNTLAGTDLLMNQIRNGLSEEEIRLSWKEDLENYIALREKYLLYPDDRFSNSEQ
jgi:uncharacterized protein YbbC (DUF1343 family)